MLLEPDLLMGGGPPKPPENPNKKRMYKRRFMKKKKDWKQEKGPLPAEQNSWKLRKPPFLRSKTVGIREMI